MPRNIDVGERPWGGLVRSLIAFAVVAGAPESVWAQERAMEWSGSMHPMGWMWGAWGFGMMLMMLVFWGLVITGIVLAVRWLARVGGGARPDRALDILRERYARGEINKDEFETKQRDLR